MAFLETTALISELWSAREHGIDFNKKRSYYKPNTSSTLVFREFHHRITGSLIILHNLLMTEDSETKIIELLASQRTLGTMPLQVLTNVKKRAGAKWDAKTIKLYIQNLLESEVSTELSSLMDDAISDETNCAIVRRHIFKGENGQYHLDVTCRKADCSCASASFLKKHINEPTISILKSSKNEDIEKMVPIFEKLIKDDDEKSVQGRSCFVVADMIHVLEAKNIPCNEILTSDKAYPELTIAVSGPAVILIPVTGLPPKGKLEKFTEKFSLLRNINFKRRKK